VSRPRIEAAGRISIGIKTSPQAVEWVALDDAWAAIGNQPVFDSAWLNDHLTDVSAPRAGASWEALTALAALIHHVPGRWVGHGVLSMTFRHPSVLAKAATVLDLATGGRLILGLGACLFEPEHTPFGFPFPAMPERFDRFESGVRVIQALMSPAAGSEAGVSQADRFYPLTGATNDPPPLTAGGPRIWLGGQKPRGIALAAELADGWLLPAVTAANSPTDLAYFAGRRAALLAALERVGRDPATFEFAAQVATGSSAASRREALAAGLEAAQLGATHIILSMPPRLGGAGVESVAREVAEPLRASLD
jgi:alkanesulfonate monooxygenase SsuD/methylene tetrahydromethanopterin reductase-like flavin-dependent oxidoreductase (luciferase family)